MGFFFSFCSVAMKFNIADPHTGAQKLFEIDDDKRLRFVLDKRISHEVNGAIIGDPIQDLTNKILPRRLGPKRANNIKKLFNLDKSDDVRMYVVRREIPSKKEGGKPKSKAPKIQRLIT